METFLGAMAVLIWMPWLALAPAALFWWLLARQRQWLHGLTAAAWTLYALYESAILIRLICDPDCNIRVDLIVIYPALVLLSLAALILALIRRR